MFTCVNKKRSDRKEREMTRDDIKKAFPDASEEQIENLKWKIYNGKATLADISRVTRRLGDEIGKVYGYFLAGI